jgi:hypothetical protein
VPKRLIVVFLSLSIFLVAGCAPEDWTNRLPYAGPWEVRIDQGASLPGTDIRYVARTEDGAEVLIDGRPTLRKIGDSLDWKGEMVRGVEVDQTLRVLFIADETLHAGGTVRIIVINPEPVAEPANDEAPVHFKLPVGYHVQRGEVIPGTVVTYAENTPEGARLEGLDEGYPYRKLGDSIVWEGKLREGLWLRLDLRTALVTDEVLDVVGTAELWIEPSAPPQ